MSPRRARPSASALRVASWLREPESCCAGSHASCMRKVVDRRAARYGMERAAVGGGPRVRSQSWEAVESEAKRATPVQPLREGEHGGDLGYPLGVSGVAS